MRFRIDSFNTQEGGGIKTVLLLPDAGSYSTDLSIGVLSYYKLVKDLVENISKNSSSSTRFILLIFLLDTLTLTYHCL